MTTKSTQFLPEFFFIAEMKNSPKPDIALKQSTYGHLFADGVSCCYLTGLLDPNAIRYDLEGVTKSTGERLNVGYLKLNPLIKAGLFMCRGQVLLAVLNYWIKNPQHTINHLRTYLPNPNDNYDVIIIEEHDSKSTKMIESLVDFFTQNDISVLVTP